MTAIPRYGASMILKRATSFCPPPHPPIGICDWEHHPSFITGIEALGAYQAWVSRVVLPIAFQWIAEHHDEVYDKIEDKKLWDDVGVVIAAAFELVRETPAYKKGKDEFEKYDKERENNTLKTEDLNPIWTKITKEVRKETTRIFQAQKEYLDDTI